MVKPIIKVKRKTARVLFWIGLLGVIIPHVAFLADVIPTLDVLAHPLLELVSAFLIYIGYINK